MNNDYIIFFSPCNDFCKKLRCRTSARWIVWIVQVKKLSFMSNFFWNFVQIWKEFILLLQLYCKYLSTQVFSMCTQHWITRHRHDRNITRIDEARRQHRQRRLRSDRVNHFRNRINPFNTEYFPQIFSSRCLKLSNSIVRITTVFFFSCFFSKLSHDPSISHLIWLAYAHVDQFNIRKILFCGCFGTFDFLEFINRGIFAVVRTTDAVCKISLNEAILVLFNTHTLISSPGYLFI
ncbi:hypothetical protein D3C76_1022810 [compost metagenome]